MIFANFDRRKGKVETVLQKVSEVTFLDLKLFMHF